MQNKTEDAQQEEHEVQDTTQDKQEEANPDMHKRVTRSGAAFLATVSPLHSIMKKMTHSQDYSMAVILTSSSSSLSALKRGIQNQDKKTLTEAEKAILSLNHTQLQPNNIFPQVPEKSQSGKNVKFTENTQVWFPDEGKYRYMILKDPNSEDSETIPMNFIQFFALDFSTRELFQRCERYQGESIE